MQNRRNFLAFCGGLIPVLPFVGLFPKKAEATKLSEIAADLQFEFVNPDEVFIKCSSNNEHLIAKDNWLIRFNHYWENFDCFDLHSKDKYNDNKPNQYIISLFPDELENKKQEVYYQLMETSASKNEDVRYSSVQNFYDHANMKFGHRKFACCSHNGKVYAIDLQYNTCVKFTHGELRNYAILDEKSIICGIPA